MSKFSTLTGNYSCKSLRRLGWINACLRPYATHLPDFTIILEKTDRKIAAT
jgi:hypothetical protein